MPRRRGSAYVCRLQSSSAPAHLHVVLGDCSSPNCQSHHAGTGEIARLVGSAAFQPQAAAFTSMLSMCAKVCFFSFQNKLHAHPCRIQAPGRAHLPLFTSLAILALAKGERLSLLGVDLSATTVPGSSL